MRVAALVAIGVVVGCGGEKKRQEGVKAQPERADAAASAAGPLIAPTTALPDVAGSGAIGNAAATRFIAAADDGSWVLVCQEHGDGERLHVVVGDGPGLEVDRVVAATDRDLLVNDALGLIHVDAVARTWRRLGPRVVGTVDAASRRIVHVDGASLIVRDPGVPPRVVPTGAPIGMIWARSTRWMEVVPGAAPRGLTEGRCGFVDTSEHANGQGARATIDLDPGAEADDRIGPVLGISAEGEVTLDGVVVVEANCIPNVVAALADPPRALVMCNQGPNRVVGPGLDRAVRGHFGAWTTATIQEHLWLGNRVVCLIGSCIDLVTGRDFDTHQGGAHVWTAERAIVHKHASGLTVDALDDERQRAIVLPRLTQAITVDTATGRRRVGPAPTPAEYIDGAGSFLLYGRYVIDVDQATLVAILSEDALAIDRSGRVLVPAGPGLGPLRWKRP